MDTLNLVERSARMGRIKSRDTRPEMAVRRMVHATGFRYRLHDKRLPGSPDLVFASKHKVMFVHGCFWHRHPDPTCPLTRTPKSRRDFWEPKFQKNRERDLRNQTQLSALGWQSAVVWECELRYPEQVKNKIRDFLSPESSA